MFLNRRFGAGTLTGQATTFGIHSPKSDDECLMDEDEYDPSTKRDGTGSIGVFEMRTKSSPVPPLRLTEYDPKTLLALKQPSFIQQPSARPPQTPPLPPLPQPAGDSGRDYAGQVHKAKRMAMGNEDMQELTVYKGDTLVVVRVELPRVWMRAEDGTEGWVKASFLLPKLNEGTPPPNLSNSGGGGGGGSGRTGSAIDRPLPRVPGSGKAGSGCADGSAERPLPPRPEQPQYVTMSSERLSKKNLHPEECGWPASSGDGFCLQRPHRPSRYCERHTCKRIPHCLNGCSSQEPLCKTCA
jgi:hypothetical protein